MQLPLRGHLQQFIVRNAAPEEERDARRQFQIAQAIGGPRRNPRRIGHDTKQEVRADEQRAQRSFDADLEAAALPAFVVEPNQAVQIRRDDRPPIGAASQRRQDLPGARRFLCRVRRWQTKIRRRAGVSSTPVALKGPVIVTVPRCG